MSETKVFINDFKNGHNFQLSIGSQCYQKDQPASVKSEQVKKSVNRIPRIPRLTSKRKAKKPTLGSKASADFRKLYKLDKTSERREFLNELRKFWIKQKLKIVRLPDLDLFRFYEMVVKNGGLLKVITEKCWPTICKELKLKNISNTLRKHYLKYLYDFECEKHGFSTRLEIENLIPQTSSSLQESKEKAGISNTMNSFHNPKVTYTANSEKITEPVIESNNMASSESTLPNKSLRLWEYIQKQQAEDQNRILKVLLTISSTNAGIMEVIDTYFENIRIEYDRFSKLVSLQSMDALKAIHAGESVLKRTNADLCNGEAATQTLVETQIQSSPTQSDKNARIEMSKSLEKTQSQTIASLTDEMSTTSTSTGKQVIYKVKGALKRKNDNVSNNPSSVKMHKSVEGKELIDGYGERITSISCHQSVNENSNENVNNKISRSPEKTQIDADCQNQSTASLEDQMSATSTAVNNDIENQSCYDDSDYNSVMDLSISQNQENTRNGIERNPEESQLFVTVKIEPSESLEGWASSASCTIEPLHISANNTNTASNNGSTIEQKISLLENTNNLTALQGAKLHPHGTASKLNVISSITIPQISAENKPSGSHYDSAREQSIGRDLMIDLTEDDIIDLTEDD